LVRGRGVGVGATNFFLRMEMVFATHALACTASTAASCSGGCCWSGLASAIAPQARSGEMSRWRNQCQGVGVRTKRAPFRLIYAPKVSRSIEYAQILGGEHSSCDSQARVNLEEPARVNAISCRGAPIPPHTAEQCWIAVQGARGPVPTLTHVRPPSPIPPQLLSSLVLEKPGWTIHCQHHS
jgi:hypothetical protein